MHTGIHFQVKYIWSWNMLINYDSQWLCLILQCTTYWMIYYYFYKSIGQVIQTTFRCKSWQSEFTRDLHFHVVINNLPFKFQLSLATACLWMIFFHGRWLSNKKNHEWKYEKCCNYSMLNISFNFFGLFQNYDLSVDLHWLELVINQGLSALLDYRNIKKNPIIILSEWLVNLGWRVVPKGAGFHSMYGGRHQCS